MNSAFEVGLYHPEEVLFGAIEATGQNVPGGQLKGADMPVAPQKCPTGQGTGALSDDALQTWRASQGTGWEAPGGQKLPSGHGWLKD